MPTKRNQVINNLTALSNFSLNNNSVLLLLIIIISFTQKNIDNNGHSLSFIKNLEGI